MQNLVGLTQADKHQLSAGVGMNFLLQQGASVFVVFEGYAAYLTKRQATMRLWKLCFSLRKNEKPVWLEDNQRSFKTIQLISIVQC